MLDKILTAQDRYKNYRLYVAKHIKERYRITPAIEWDAPRGNPVSAYILRGSWVVGCECLETIYYQPGEAFFCPNCLNATNGHAPRPVLMPDNRQAIEAALLERPNPQNRNWLLGETLDLLQAQNIIHLGA